MLRCWQEEPGQRPTFGEILQAVRALAPAGALAVVTSVSDSSRRLSLFSTASRAKQLESSFGIGAALDASTTDDFEDFEDRVELEENRL
jgi:hypothetical protein